eukprot:CAMPEP_0182455406 /NCGR_PEP_ID=MMETSP1319-20130603/1587_1 /TAXON_ID=172717 /ORGANISM="Bolidomonas pacifica, Strain RCC208" /LENGTH=58 /DNA_ID=CAMNT_0024653459 /DNA_START=349 /DNA_END=525 /DNA_ORIENTATION=+
MTALTFVTSSALLLTRLDLLPEEEGKRRERLAEGRKRGQVRLAGDMRLGGRRKGKEDL